MPSSLLVVRSLCNPHCGPEQPLRFTLQLADVEGDYPRPRVAVLAEIQTLTAAQTHFVAVTVAMTLVASEADDQDQNEIPEQLADVRQAGPWAAHLLWDFACTQLRLLASGLQRPQLSLPVVTPAPILLDREGEPLQ